jgi:molybdopterin/thiamine biosynthesis adenylyltransferase
MIGIIKKVSDTVLLVTDVAEPNRRGDIDCSRGHLNFSSKYIRRVQLQGKKNKANGLIFFHTHPFSEDDVSFSQYDDTEEPRLMANLRDVWPSSEHIGVVVGKKALMARVYPSNGIAYPINDLFVVGRTLKVMPGDGCAQIPARPEHIFDRAEVITNTGALATLGKLQIAIVGAGGTGSLMVELLERAGCKNMLLIDDDYVDETNLNRLLHTSLQDVREKRKKVYAAAYAAYLTGMGCNVEVIDGNIVDDRSIHARLKESDILIGCVDKDTPRYILNQIAVESCVPYIDLGTEIGAKDGVLQSLDIRVTYVHPGGPCLECRGLINHDNIRLEGLQPEERKRQVGLGYCRDIDIRQPAVMELNMRAASLASLFIRHLFQPFLDVSLGTDMRESLLLLKHKQPNLKKERKQPCEICGFC